METVKSLADVMEGFPPERILFKGDYLCKGKGMVIAAQTGSGASTFALQCALHWALGKPCFGIDPVRPLKVAVASPECNARTLAMLVASMRQGLAAEGFSPERIDEAFRRLDIHTDFLGRTGATFSDALGNMQSKHHYDLVIVDPFVAYFDNGRSLYKDISPVINNPATECGIIFIHHMAKPAKGKDAATWGEGAYAQYALLGDAMLLTWACAVLVFTPFENAPDFWTLTAAKRHKPLAWKDADGNPTKDKIIAHSENIIYWRVPSAEEIAAAKSGATPSRKQETEAERKQREDAEYRQAMQAIVGYLQPLTDKISKTDLRNWCIKTKGVFSGFQAHTVKKPDGTFAPPKPCYNAFDHFTANPEQYGVACEKRNGYTYYGGVAPVTGDTVK